MIFVTKKRNILTLACCDPTVNLLTCMIQADIANVVYTTINWISAVHSPTGTSSSVSCCRPEIASLPAYNAGLASDAVKERYGLDTIAKLGSNENPHGAPPEVREALTGLFDKLALYPEAEPRLRERLALYLNEQMQAFILGNGSEQLIRMIMQGVVSPGDRVVTVLPSFGLHILNAVAMGGVVDAVPVTDACEFDLEALCAAVSARTRILIFSNPSNPVGCMMTEAQLETLINACPPDCLIVVDEAYREYAAHTAHYPDARRVLRRQSRPWIVLGTFSKAWGLAGLRIGWALSDTPALINALEAVRDPFNTNIVAQLAALAALEGETHMRESVTATVRARDTLKAGIEDMGLDVAPSSGNFLFVRLPCLAAPVAEALLRHGVIVKPWKEPGFTDRIRVSIGLDEENKRFTEALRIILAEPPALEELP